MTTPTRPTFPPNRVIREDRWRQESQEAPRSAAPVIFAVLLLAGAVAGFVLAWWLARGL